MCGSMCCLFSVHFKISSISLDISDFRSNLNNNNNAFVQPQKNRLNANPPQDFFFVWSIVRADRKVMSL